MKTRTWLIAISLALMMSLSASGVIALKAGPASTDDALGSAFTYQGFLTAGGAPADGTYDFRFRLFDRLEGGNQVGSTLRIEVVPVSAGLFSVQLDFGTAPFRGAARWLEVAVQPATMDDNYTALSPRQALTAAPYALYSEQVGKHDHLGETWTGADNSLVLSGSFGTASQQAPLYLYNSTGHGLRIGQALWAGVRVESAGGAGVSVGTAAWDGLIVSTANRDGVHVEGAGNVGAYANTLKVSGEWGFYTPDKIRANSLTTSSLNLLAQVAGSASLSPGDLAAAVGLGEPAPGGTIQQPLVAPASQGGDDGLIGVVASCMAYITQEDQEAESDTELLHSVAGPCQPGDYVALTVLGVAEVRVDPVAELQPGMRLTASAVAGVARPLRTETLNGMTIAEGAPVLGIVLEALQAGEQTIPVFVTLR